VVDASTGNVVLGPTPLSPADVPEIPALPSHADENGYNWPAKSLSTSAAWESGLYYADVMEDGIPIEMSRAFFAVRSAGPSRSNRIVIHWPIATAHAYAYLDSWGKRASLYDSIHLLRSRRTSTQRPLVGPQGQENLDGLKNSFGGTSATVVLLRWLRSLGPEFDADVCSSWDLHSDPTALNGYRLLILAGHDEYWSREMRDQVEGFVAGGGHVAAFTGNSVWWQIRYAGDGSQVICYKDALEDPLVGTDDSRVTANWSADIPGRPENRLTGVGFRYGWMGGSGPLKIVPPQPGGAPHPVFEGLVDGQGAPLERFGAGLGGNTEAEADGIELDLTDPARPRPTFRDGTPDTFTVLAYNEKAGGGGPIGRAVMGFYTNRGTVLACPVTNWIDQIAVDPDVARVTANAIQWLLQRGDEAPMGPSRAMAAPRAWTSAASGSFTAIAGNAQGRFFVASPGGLRSQHPDLNSVWQPVALPPLPAGGSIRTMGCDLYGAKLFAAVSNRLFSLDVGENAVSLSSELPAVATDEYFVGVAGMDHMGTMYALIGSDGGRVELRVLALDNSGWLRVGDAGGLCAITACGGYLVARVRTCSSRVVQEKPTRRRVHRGIELPA